jgi:hypothetical protein
LNGLFWFAINYVRRAVLASCVSFITGRVDDEVSDSTPNLKIFLSEKELKLKNKSQHKEINGLGAAQVWKETYERDTTPKRKL